MKHKIHEWLRRYVPREIVGTITALAASLATYRWTGSEVASALAGTWGENLGFYGYGITKEVLHYLERHRDVQGYRRLFLVGYKTLRNMILEFGPAESLDSFIVRPALMYVSQVQLGPVAGTLSGKIAADVIFYALAVAAYEMRKKHIID